MNKDQEKINSILGNKKDTTPRSMHKDPYWNSVVFNPFNLHSKKKNNFKQVPECYLCTKNRKKKFTKVILITKVFIKTIF